ncbi:DUF2961 domain-containing protein [Flavivirga eckloniae]|nr:DUF2961 domain-containing protein [Flavivirga eckloniae]
MGQIYNYQEDVKTKSIWESTIVKANSSKVFTEIEGPGIIKKLWLTTFPSNDKENIELAKNVIINIYWENSESAAVSVPLADFFCQPLKLQAIENHFFHSTNNQLLFASTIPMPFRKTARLEVKNSLDKEFELFFGIDIESKVIEKDAMYLHTYWQNSIDLSADEPFLILPELNGKGRYLGTHLSLYQRNPFKNWPWYTRPVTIFLDSKSNNQKPSLYIKTLDDFFGSAWWDREDEHNTYTYQYIGRPLVETDKHNNLKIVLYRYHIQEPLWFKESIKIEIGKNWNWGNQKIESGNWTTTSFLYLNEPSNEFNLKGKY